MPNLDVSKTAQRIILGCASQGTGSSDEARLRDLLSRFQARYVSFNKARKLDSFKTCLRALRAGGFDLFALEGTGISAGLAAILGRILWKRPYVVSSGDAVAPFLSSRLPAGSPLFRLYERLLYTFSAGFIGWTPYLVGRALTMGATRGVTIPGWAPFRFSRQDLEAMRRSTRESLGIPESAVVFGIAGSLVWSSRYQFCYGAELVRAARRCSVPPYILIVGGGSGLEKLKELAGDQVGKRILFPGRVPREDVARYLAAMDLGSLPQSVDGVGNFRYTTKLPEYRSASLLIVTNQTPMSYDLDRGDIVRLRGESPWDEIYLRDLADLMQSLGPDDVRARKNNLPAESGFDREEQMDHVTAFLSDIVASTSSRAGHNS